MPSIIYRPSVIVGDSITGQTSAFNVIYIPAQFLTRGFFPLLPATPTTPFDLIPVDYTADAIVSLASKGVAGDCFHIAAGAGREPTIFDIVDTLFACFGKFLDGEKSGAQFPLKPEMIALAQLSLNAAVFSVKNIEKFLGERVRLLNNIMPYLMYMNRNPQFDTSKTDRLLGAELGDSPLFKNYGETLFNYCFQTNWGKIPWTNPAGLPAWSSRVIC